MSFEERQGQPLVTGADSQYWKSADWVIFQTRLETARPELPEARAPTPTTSPEKGVQGSNCRGWPQLLQRTLREPSRSDAAVMAEHEAQVKPVSRVKDPWSATGWPRTGLEHHQPIVHLSQKLGVYTLGNVGDLVWICSYIIDFDKYLLVVELTVLEVPHGRQCPHTGICIVVRVLTHTVRETLLERQFTS